MKTRFSTVRLRYIYIGGASALLSAALLFVVYHVLRFAHHHVLPDTAWITRMMNWGINHIGTKPFFIFIGGAVFAIFFWIRSQKIAEDLSQLARGTAELALGHNPGRIDVLSGGELRQIAANLNRIAILLHEEGRSRSEPKQEKREIQGASIKHEQPGLQQHVEEDKENAQTTSTQVDLPIKLTLYGIESSLDEIIEGRCQDEVEVQHWAKLAYEQTLLLQHALEITQRNGQERGVSMEQVHKEPEC
ncbi:hypothetical protein ACMX2M_17200 [Paenibacillus polymyxa]|uniref:HAMP domain-containing protein n=1 Tax=Paenibacillus TaxID=44249 RepID=UPI0010599ACA|nr:MULTISPECIES: hypothetical protein [Paenibacillus]MCL6660136.1 hypothetical protein [Paenibacillus amylolyticus]TDL64614.1 hypothetical protein E2R58_23565 [Paenibacillus amylolyticus]UOK64936.1 hypothetical protein MT997_11385 [Paenibacillus sp. OVF10]WJM09739.1 hypothetical protein QNO02_07365 [Paenibacillus sp. PK1-4R]